VITVPTKVNFMLEMLTSISFHDLTGIRCIFSISHLWDF